MQKLPSTKQGSIRLLHEQSHRSDVAEKCKEQVRRHKDDHVRARVGSSFRGGQGVAESS